MNILSAQRKLTARLKPIRKRPIIALVAIVCLSAVAAFAAHALRGSGNFTGHATVTPLAGGHQNLDIVADGIVTHLGKSIVRLHTEADFSGSVPSPLPPSTGTITAANGDTISFILKWTVEEIAPGIFYTVGPFTIIGGTGRFAAASGGGDYEGIVDVGGGDVEARITGELVH